MHLWLLETMREEAKRRGDEYLPMMFACYPYTTPPEKCPRGRTEAGCCGRFLRNNLKLSWADVDMLHMFVFDGSVELVK